jgi:hypothetical protein
MKRRKKNTKKRRKKTYKPINYTLHPEVVHPFSLDEWAAQLQQPIKSRKVS